MDRRRDEWDEDGGLDEIDFDEDRDLGSSDDDTTPAEELLDALQAIECQRDRLRAAASHFEAILASDSDLQQQWRQFTRSGGISAHDFRRFLAGDPLRYRPTRQRRHLRLVVNQKRRPTVIRRSHGGDHVA